MWMCELVLKAELLDGSPMMATRDVGSYKVDVLGACARALAAIQDACALGSLVGVGWHVEELQCRQGVATTVPWEEASGRGRASADRLHYAGRAAATGSLRWMAGGLVVVAVAHAALYHASIDGDSESALKFMLSPAVEAAWTT
jgi:hypothetical protein